MQLESITDSIATSVADLIDLEEAFYDEALASSQQTWAFRGQSQTFGTLLPSFCRRFEGAKSEKTVEFIESELIKDFRRHYASLGHSLREMPPPDEIAEGRELRCLSVMQHYGVPTRLLDWTTDFWTAIYFACSGNPEHDAELWCYNRDLFRDKSEAAKEQDAALAVVLPAFDLPILGRRDLKLVVEVSQQQTPRMKQQKAHHTVASSVFADHAPLMFKMFADSSLPEARPDGFGRIVVSQRCKDKALKYLDEHKGRSASTIFPDLEGLGRFLRWQLDSLVTTLL